MNLIRQQPEFKLSFEEWFAQKFGALQMNEAQKTEIKTMFEKIRILADIVDVGLNIELRQERAIQHMNYTWSSRNQVSEVLSKREPSREDSDTYEQRKNRYSQSISRYGMGTAVPGTPTSQDEQWPQNTTYQHLSLIHISEPTRPY